MPRPFPLPISIGTDICSLQRIGSILAHPTRIGYGARFINKVFTDLEKNEDNGPFKAKIFPYLERYDRYLQQKLALEGKKVKFGAVDADTQSEMSRMEEQLHREDINMRRELDKHARSVGGRSVKYSPEDLFENPRAEYLLRFRFAAKEAAIKAYRSRRLTYRDVSILRYDPSITTRPTSTASIAPIALIKNEHAGTEEDAWLDAQQVPVSISHDGDFATAVCMASEQPLGDIRGQAEEEEGHKVSEAQPYGSSENQDSLPRSGSSSLSSASIPDSDTMELYRSTVFIFSLDFRTKKDDLQLILRQPRYVPKIAINRDPDGKSLGTAFAVMASPEDAVRAVKHLKELKVLNRYVGSDTCDKIHLDNSLQKRLERIVEPSTNATRFERWNQESLDKCVGAEEFPGLRLARLRYTEGSAEQDTGERDKEED
ncbi:hypothetical protein BP5796_05265 [Coleophoma crateriformis]|uniref:RRM domain-containing protein n=1 Tax=Coleophoma crateriformis TaxID=565419 RepID=A0A3D8S2N5_9HELO|nr:hypothetical protein BP5796_05265 [Coleophoma crateriformis]